MRSLKKKPLQIYIEPGQELLLENLAKEKRISKAEIVRLSLNRYLSSIPLDEDPALGIIGLGRSGKGDISEKHDSYLDQYTSKRSGKHHKLPHKRKIG